MDALGKKSSQEKLTGEQNVLKDQVDKMTKPFPHRSTYLPYSTDTNSVITVMSGNAFFFFFLPVKALLLSSVG